MADRDATAAREPIDLSEEPEFEIGPLTVRPAERAVVMGDQRRLLQPRVMKVLIALAQARPRVVSRDRLIDRCWDGRIVGDDSLNRCVLALRHLAQEFTPQPFTIETVPRVGHRLAEGASGEHSGLIAVPSRPWQEFSLVPLLLLVLIGSALALAVLRPWDSATRMPTVIITSAAGDPVSRALAQDLTGKLVSFEAAGSPGMRLLEEADRSSGKPDLILEAGRSGDPKRMAAVLLLKSGSDRSLLWSEEMEQPSGGPGDLSQQLAFTAARVLDCAGEALAEPLSQQNLKTYLNACAALADLSGREAMSVIPMLNQVLKDAPRFDGAWESLLQADMQVAEHTQSIDDMDRLKADLSAAKKASPQLPAVLEAEILLLPVNAYLERIRLANHALALHPANARAYATRAQLLQAVGRMKDGVVDARRATQLDPLSPIVRTNYISALGAAGLYDAARQELREAERLWPGAKSVAGARFAFNLRYGDPLQAWHYLRSEPSADWMNARPYLEARLDRTPPKIERAIEHAERLYRSSPQTMAHLVQVYGEFNRNKDLLELLLRAPEPEVQHIDLTFRAPVIDLWNDPRSLQLAKRVGLLRYWQVSDQWPDFCHAPDLSYDCKAEAAKKAAVKRG